jgi:hypothetical protein
MTPARRAPFLLAVALAVAGCGSSGEDEAARQVVDRFEAALTTGRGAEACELLTAEVAEDVDCAALDLPRGTVRDVEVWGDAAQARVGDDTVFLREKAVGWRISGAGCTPDGERPYECEVGGP